MKALIVSAAMLAILACQSAVAEGDATAGQSKSAVCAACHGSDGNSVIAQWPKLAGQHEDYLARQIKLVQSNAREVPEMAPMVAGLSDQDINDLAAYYASRSIKYGVADPAAVVLGSQIWNFGNTETEVAACKACHGPAGGGIPISGFPALAGQHSLYIANSLNKFRSGTVYGENDANSKIMAEVAKNLTDEEIQAVSSYIEGLHPVTE